MSDAKVNLNDSSSSSGSKESSDKTSKYTSSEELDKHLMPSPNESTPQSAETKSSGNNTSSNPTSGTTSSADTVPTQEVGDSLEDGPVRGNLVWGVLLALQPEFAHLNLTEKRYTFGRGQHCDYSLHLPSLKHTKYFKHYSKNHFAISRTTKEDGSTDQVFVEDLGGVNGTYINGERIPSHNKRAIKVSDKIAMSVMSNEVFVFVHNTNATDERFHSDFTEKYIVHRQLGKGACGEVYETWSKVGDGRFAAKAIHKTQLSMYSEPNVVQKDLKVEAEILRKLEHPCIISVHDVIDTPKDLYIVLEYAGGGELFNRVANQGRLSENIAKLYFYQMLRAVTYLHENGITHRDLKPENILLMSSSLEPCLIKITDFGMSRLVEEQSLMMTLAGTPSYLAPEIVKNLQSSVKEGYTKLVDLWSLGVILYVCLVAYPPFGKGRSDTKQTVNEQIMSANYIFPVNQWGSISKDAKDLVCQLLQLNVKQRLTTSQSLKHPWLTDSKMLAQASALMYPNGLPVTSEMIEKNFRTDSADTRKISTDNDDESSGTASRTSSDNSSKELVENLETTPCSVIKCAVKRHIDHPNAAAATAGTNKQDSDDFLESKLPKLT